MKLNRIVFTGVITLFGIFAAVTPAKIQAQTDYDVYQNAFQVTVPINIDNFNFTPVTIPTGKRLVIQNVSFSGAALTSGTYIQPVIIIASTLGSNTTNNRYFAPNQSGTVPGQYYEDFETTMYADTLAVSPAYAGFAPTFLAFNVVITGYLVSMPQAPPALKSTIER